MGEEMNIERQLKVMQATLIVMAIALGIGFFYIVHLHNQLKRDFSADVNRQIRESQSEFIAEGAAPIMSFRKAMGGKEIEVHSIGGLIEAFFGALFDPLDIRKEINSKP